MINDIVPKVQKFCNYRGLEIMAISATPNSIEALLTLHSSDYDTIIHCCVLHIATDDPDLSIEDIDDNFILDNVSDFSTKNLGLKSNDGIYTHPDISFAIHEASNHVKKSEHHSKWFKIMVDGVSL